MVSLRELANDFVNQGGYPIGTLIKVKMIKVALLPENILGADVYVKATMSDRAKKIGSVAFHLGNF